MRKSAFDGITYLSERNSNMRDVEERKLQLEKEALAVRLFKKKIGSYSFNAINVLMANIGNIEEI